MRDNMEILQQSFWSSKVLIAMAASVLSVAALAGTGYAFWKTTGKEALRRSDEANQLAAAREKLVEARVLMTQDDVERGTELLEQVIAEVPGTPIATQAREALDELENGVLIGESGEYPEGGAEVDPDGYPED